MWAVRVLMWGFWLLMCNIAFGAFGAPIYHYVDREAKVKWEKKSSTLRHLGNKHQVIFLVTEANLQELQCVFYVCASEYIFVYVCLLSVPHFKYGDRPGPRPRHGHRPGPIPRSILGH